jgi:RNA-directed DNA polymerase
MENKIKEYARTLKGEKRRNQFAINIIRYADDFVILHENLDIIKECQEIIKTWLAEMGLELKPSKTKISHTLNEHEGNVGFDFLGFTIRQFPVGKYHSGKNSKGKPLGFKTIITPSKAKIKTHINKLNQVVRKHKSSPQIALIKELNPIIRGWSNYYATVCSKETFSQCENVLYQQLKRWGLRRHPMKNTSFVVNKYWHSEGNRNWIFSTRDGDKAFKLCTHSETPIVRHVKVQGERSLFDGDLIYWSSRLGKHPEMPTEKATLLKKQKGKCNLCGLMFKDGDLLETDHILPLSLGGKNHSNNKQLLHRHCHDVKTANDGSLTRTHDKGFVGEKPCEVKVSCTVLKTSSNREVTT